MSRESLLIGIGLLVLLSPFLGLPYSWLMVLLPVLGAVVSGVAFTLKTRRATETSHEEGTDA